MGSRYAKGSHNEEVNLNKAKEALKQSLSYDPRNLKAKDLYDKIQRSQDQGTIAANAYVHMFKVKQNQDEASILSAFNYVAKARESLSNCINDEEGIKLLTALQYQYSDYANKLGLIYWKDNDTVKALQYLTKAVASDPNKNAVIQNNFAQLASNVAMRDIKNVNHPSLVQTSIVFLRDAEKVCPNNQIIRKTLAGLYFILAKYYDIGFHVESDQKKASDLLCEALVLDPDNSFIKEYLEKITGIKLPDNVGDIIEK